MTVTTATAAWTTELRNALGADSVAVSVSAQPSSAVAKAERDVTLGGSFGPGPIVAGQGNGLEYRLTYTNTGNADATGVTLTDLVPVQSTFPVMGSKLETRSQPVRISWSRPSARRITGDA